MRWSWMRRVEAGEEKERYKMQLNEEVEVEE